MGPVFLVAGVAGLTWRLRHMGLAVFRDGGYLAAVGVFGTLVGGVQPPRRLESSALPVLEEGEAAG